MRLPNFLDHLEFNALRQLMGAHELGEVNLSLSPNRLTVVELETLMTGGIDIKSLDEVIVLPDGTLGYKDRRVLLYIRDVPLYRNNGSDIDSLPKFHVANCKKLRDMRAQNRYSRYVVAVRDDGSFRLNLIGKGLTRTVDQRLKVCQFCLSQLPYRNFSHDMPRSERAVVVDQFTVQRFFQMWPRDFLSGEGLDSEATAPLNDYTGDFGEHADAAKETASWKCQECGKDLRAHRLRRYLHAHHLNGVKFDNRPQNLLVLCISCHANQPGHGHMKALPELAEYLRVMQ